MAVFLFLNPFEFSYWSYVTAVITYHVSYLKKGIKIKWKHKTLCSSFPQRLGVLFAVHISSGRCPSNAHLISLNHVWQTQITQPKPKPLHLTITFVQELGVIESRSFLPPLHKHI